MIETKIELLKSQISKLDKPDFDLNAWKGSTTVLLERIFGESYSAIKTIKQIQNRVSDLRALGGNYRNNINQCKQQGKEILEATITELEKFGLPETTKKNGSGIEINLTQNQTVNVNLILSAIKDELTKSQWVEIEKLLKVEEVKSTKHKKIIEKISGFGTDVASNILANILTNPNLWG
ncbi:MAG: hypothetical protein CVT92_11165 [Bacteroidetes bacterium HGW-Bacteroidetes-1]|jgi:histone deacetylase complex regulatory component SIN3|nr:MAG: hypothetical protein CVT92_11165 [Bacteroidetes bacterium HGW-Bacteroidetes-1]